MNKRTQNKTWHIVAVKETWTRFHEVLASSAEEAALIVNETITPGREGTARYESTNQVEQWEVVDTGEA